MYGWSTAPNGVVLVTGSPALPPVSSWAKKKLPEVWATYRKEIDAACDKYGVPRSWVVSFIISESGGNPNAPGGSGEAGLMQLMPNFWKPLGMSFKDACDPAWNIGRGTMLLRERLACHKWSLPEAASSYNCGCNLKAGSAYKRSTEPWGLCAASQKYLTDVVIQNNYAIEVLGISGAHADVYLPADPTHPVTPSSVTASSSGEGGGLSIVGLGIAAAAAYGIWRISK